MLYNPPIGGASNDPYIDGSPGTGTPGSPVPAHAIEYPQREIVAAIVAAGLTPNNSILNQLAAAIPILAAANQLSWAATDTGTANHFVATLAPAPTSYENEMQVALLTAHANTGASDINLNSLGVKTIKKLGPAGTLIDTAAGDIPSGIILVLSYDGTYFQIVSRITPSAQANAYCGVTTNSGNNYSITTTPSFSAATAGQIIAAQFNAANTGGITLNPNGTGAITVLNKDGHALGAGDVITSENYLLFNNGTNLIILGSGPPSVKTIKRQVFTSSATYTPTTGMLYCDVEVLGGGAAGGGANSPQATAAGGGAGGYSKKVVAASTIGSSQSVTIGAAGTGGSSSGGVGGTGGTTSLGSILSATGGVGGTGSTTAPNAAPGGVGGTGSGGDVNFTGAPGTPGFVFNASSEVTGTGGSSNYGAGGPGLAFSSGSSTAGNAATGYGSGGGGAFGSTATGGTGTPGIVIITEYCS